MKQEPSADLRRAGVKLRELFEALVDAGFTEAQTLIIIGQAIGAAVKQQ